jgi:hypothetical protein
MSPDILLFLMFAAYALPIAFVYSKYQDSAATTRSISSIITSQEPFISIADNNAPPSLRHPDKAFSRSVYDANGVFYDSL